MTELVHTCAALASRPDGPRRRADRRRPRLLLRHRHAQLRAGMLDADAPAIDRLRFQEPMAALPQAIRALPQPVIAAVNGPCVGAGFALCLAADIRICSTAASFGNGAILLGLSGAEMGMSYHLPRIVGTSVAADWMLTGRTVSARGGRPSRTGQRDSSSRTRCSTAALELAVPHRRSRAAGGSADQARAAGQHRRVAGLAAARTREPQPGAHPRHRRRSSATRSGRVTARAGSEGNDDMSWDFATDPEWAEQLAWVEEFVRTECEPIDYDRQGIARPERPGAPGADPAAAADRQGPRAVGHPPRPAPRRPRLRPDEARAAQRDPRPVRVRADRVRFARTGFRQQRDPRALRHARAQGALPRAAARQPDHLLLLDDRTAGRRRPEGVHHQRGPGRQPLGHQRREVVSRRSPRRRRSSS